MNNRTLRDFFYGNLTPADRQMIQGSEIARITEELSKTENLLNGALPPDLLPILKRLVKAQATLTSLTAETHYIEGFKTGARFMMEILDDTYENLKPITE